MASELKPRRRAPKPPATDDRLERMKGSDPPKRTEPGAAQAAATAIEIAYEMFKDDLAAPDEVEALIEEMNATAATVITPEGKVADATTGEVITPPDKKRWKPSDKDLIVVKGGKQYLPARLRINWLRGGDPDAHPDWGIQTALLEHERGTRKSGKVEGGYAMFAASIVDSSGKVIATGHKTEYSENFADYVEKAETGAIARALAVAGYGTESAMDLDEGFEADRLADAPAGTGQPIVISGSDVKDVRQGGRQKHVTQAQVTAIKGEVKRLGVGPAQLGKGIEKLGLYDFNGDADEQTIADAMTNMTFDEAGTLLKALMDQSVPKGGEDDDVEVDESDEVPAK